MNAARAHGSIHIDAGELGDNVIDIEYDNGGRLGVRIIDGPFSVWISGTPDQFDEFLTDMRAKVTAAFADRAIEREVVPS